jgi:hypothetical protein
VLHLAGWGEFQGDGRLSEGVSRTDLRRRDLRGERDVGQRFLWAMDIRNVCTAHQSDPMSDVRNHLAEA